MKLSLSSKKNQTIGIDIDENSVTVVRATHTNGMPVIDFCGMLDVELSHSDWENKLKSFLSQNNLTPGVAATCLDDASFKIRKIELPKMPDTDMREAVKWKMRDVVEGAIDDYSVRYSTLGPTQDTKRVSMVGYAVKKKSVEDVVARLGRVGLNAKFVEPSVVSLASSIETQGSEEWTAAIDLGVVKSVMVIIGNGRFYFSRPLTGLAFNQSDVQSFNQKLAAEIQNSLDTFAVTYHIEQMSRLFLTGVGSLTVGLDDYLTQNLGISTQLANPFVGVSIDKKLLESLKDKLPLYSQAVALAKVKL